MLWLALHLPNLPLDALHLCPMQTQSEAWIVVEQHARQERVVALNPRAGELGIRVGQHRSAAQALAAQLRVAKRHIPQESALLDSLAAWAMQFTPTVCLDPPAGLLLEIAGCLDYFKGLPRLRRRILDGLATLSLPARVGLASTPLAAAWFAQLGVDTQADSAASLEQALAHLPVARLPWPEDWRRRLDALGLRRLGDLRKLPGAGLGRRFGQDLLLTLDKAYGRCPDPRPLFMPADRFERKVELSWATDQIEALGFVAQRLLGELAVFSAGRGLGVQQVLFQFKHSDGSNSDLPVGFGKPTRSAAAMQAITHERLSRLALPAAVEAISLSAEKLHRLDGATPGLFGDATAAADFDLLLARLAARLGEPAIRALACIADHRPECAWAIVPDGTASPILEVSERPGWLLPEPIPLEIRSERPWYGEPLILQGRMERIESGWWDGDTVARDYFRAQGPSGRRYWLYQKRGEANWYLHGLFA